MARDPSVEITSSGTIRIILFFRAFVRARMDGPIATFIVRSSELNAMNQREKQATRAGHAKLGYLLECRRDTIRFAGNNGGVLIQRVARACGRHIFRCTIKVVAEYY